MRTGDERSRYGVRLLGAVSTIAGVAGMVWTARETHRPHQGISALASVLGIGFSALGLIVGAASLLISWLTYQADRREHSDALSLSDIADEFAVAVRGQWEAEARVRRLNDPYPLPVSWLPADSELVEPWPLLVRMTRTAPDAWPAGSDALAGTDDQIVDVFTRRLPGGRLVILGEPGSGKTMLLVRLLLDLTARRTAGAPVPVIFPLASWNPAEQELDAWMAHRLSTDYPGLASGYGTTDRAHALLERRLVLPLLDGFDELPPRHRAVALDAINRALPPGHPLVLSSRLTEYRAALAPASGVPVRVTAAAGIELQPLTANDATAYLRRDAGGEGTYSAARWDLVASLLGTAAPVARALTTPLALFLARTIYNPRPGEATADLPAPSELCDLARFPSSGDIRLHLFDAFVPGAYRPHPRRPCRWTPEQAQRYLAFLARHLERNVGGAVDLAWWQLRLAVPPRGLRLMTGGALGMALYIVTLLGVLVAIAGDAAGLHSVWGALAQAASIGLWPLWALPELSADWTGLAITLAFVLPLADLIIGLILSWATGLRPRTEPATRMRWSGSLRVLLFSLGIAVAVGVPLGIRFELPAGGWGIAAGLVVCLVTGWGAAPADVSAAASPSALLGQDRRTLRLFTGTGVAGGCALGVGLGVLLAYTEARVSANYDVPLSENLWEGAALGLSVGFLSGLVLGLAAALNRTASGPFALARRYLAARRSLPRDVMAFLADAHERRGVLRQVGTVYQFRHIDLQHRLAERP
jgi:hypothetical protein